MACHPLGAKPLSEPMQVLLTGPLGTNFSEIWIKAQQLSYKKMNSKISSAKWRLFCVVLNVLKSSYNQPCILLSNKLVIDYVMLSE